MALCDPNHDMEYGIRYDVDFNNIASNMVLDTIINYIIEYDNILISNIHCMHKNFGCKGKIFALNGDIRVIKSKISYLLREVKDCKLLTV